jgi:phage shock protein A
MNVSASQSSKGFWQRPESTVGMVLVILLAGGIGTLGYFFSDWIIGIMQQPLGLTVVLMIFAALTFILLDRSMRTLMSYFFQSTLRTITSWFVTIDPIKVLQNYATELSENMAKINRQMHRLRGQIHLMNEQIMVNQNEIEQNLSLAAEAKTSGDTAIVGLHSRKIGRLEQSNERLQKLLNRMEAVYEGLSNMKQHSYVLQEDITDQLELKRKERKAVNTSHSAMEAAMEMMDKGGEGKRDYDEALEDIADDVSRKIGEMEHFMNLSDDFMKSFDLRKGVLEDEGLQRLESWKKKHPTQFLESSAMSSFPKDIQGKSDAKEKSSRESSTS